MAVTGFAQTIYYSEDFESTTGTALPTGWTQTVAVGAPSATVGWNSGTNTTLGSSGFAPPAHTRFIAVNDDAASAANNTNSFVKSSSFSLATATAPYLSFDCAYLAGTYGGNSETATVEVSTNGGTSWTVVSTLAANAVNWWEGRYINLSAYAGQASVMLGFRYNDGGGWEYGWAIDNISVFAPQANDIALTAISPVAPANYVQDGAPGYSFTGTMFNHSSSTITSFDATVVVGAGSPATTTISGISIVPFGSYNFTCNPYVVPNGSQNVTMWVTKSGDPVLSNDTMTTTVIGVDTLQPKRVMIEEFTQASCDPCAQAAPNVDSVYANNLGRSILVRYHVNWPGRDCMDSVTLTPFVSAMVSFYGVTGVPDAKMDGTDIYPGAGGLSTAAIGDEATGGSPMKITVTPSFDPLTNTYSFTANVKAYTAMPSGLVLRAVLAVDTITYASNQSTETISQTVFPEVAENMFPSASGTTLTAFTTGSTQTVTKSWVKNHAWGSNRSVWAYDSTNFAQIVVWVEDNTNKYVFQAASAMVNTIVPAGVNAVTSDNGSMDIYPNPASRTATVAINLKTSADVKMEVYNILGQLTYSMPTESRNAGNSVSTIDVSNFAAGEYFVKVLIGNEVLNKKLTITK